MTLEIKDLIYFLTVIGAFAGMWFKVGGRVANMEQSISTFKKVMFKPNGELGLVTPEQCKRRRDVLRKAQENADIRYANIEKELRDLSQNVLIIMIHLNIDVEETKKKGIGHG